MRCLVYVFLGVEEVLQVLDIDDSDEESLLDIDEEVVLAETIIEIVDHHVPVEETTDSPCLTAMTEEDLPNNDFADWGKIMLH